MAADEALLPLVVSSAAVMMALLVITSPALRRLVTFAVTVITPPAPTGKLLTCHAGFGAAPVGVMVTPTLSAVCALISVSENGTLSLITTARAMRPPVLLKLNV